MVQHKDEGDRPLPEARSLLSLPYLRPQPTRILYVVSVVIVGLFLMGFLWTVIYAVIAPVHAGISASMAQYDVENSTYASFEFAVAFMFNLFTFLLVIFVLGLLYWVWLYSQRKNIGGAMY